MLKEKLHLLGQMQSRWHCYRLEFKSNKRTMRTQQWARALYFSWTCRLLEEVLGKFCLYCRSLALPSQWTLKQIEMTQEHESCLACVMGGWAQGGLQEFKSRWISALILGQSDFNSTCHHRNCCKLQRFKGSIISAEKWEISHTRLCKQFTPQAWKIWKTTARTNCSYWQILSRLVYYPKSGKHSHRQMLKKNKITRKLASVAQDYEGRRQVVQVIIFCGKEIWQLIIQESLENRILKLVLGNLGHPYFGLSQGVLLLAKHDTGHTRLL